MNTTVKAVVSITAFLVVHSLSGFGNENSFTPGNDNFADRITIAGAKGTANGSNFGATHETGEPWITSWFVNGTNSVWWTWTCPTTGLYGFDTIASGFNSALGIFTGDELTNLEKKVFSNYLDLYDGSRLLNGYVKFNATVNQTYQIAVAGSSDSDQGNIVLNWYPETLVVYSNAFTTNYTYNVFLAPNGSVLQTHMITYGHQTLKTNIKEVIVTDYIYENTYTNISVTDRKNRKIVDIDGFSDIDGAAKRVASYDGKLILVTEYKVSTNNDVYIHVYSVAGNGLKNGNVYYVSNDFNTAVLDKKWIYIETVNRSYWTSKSLYALDKNLKKVVWEYTPSLQRGGMYPVFPNGVAVYQQWDPTTDYFFEIGKKGKPYGAHVVNRPAAGYLSFKLDDKGGILFWNGNNGTNGPMTYIDRKNNERVTGFLPDHFTLFNRWDFDGKTLFLGKASGSSIDIRTYKWSKNPKLNGETTVAGYKSIMLADSKLYILTTNGNEISVSEFDKKLSKVKWENSGPGYKIEYLGNKVFYREATNATTKTLTFFKKENVIVEHVIDK